MNYLAHFLLSEPEPDALVGSMLADFSRGVDLSSFSLTTQEAVRRHFLIDAFTDAHPIVRKSKDRISPPHRRYAGVLVDIFYDHFLARSWERFSTEALPVFSRRVYEALLSQQSRMPERMQRSVNAMIAGDWLGSYAEVENIETALGRMARRLTRVNDLGTGGLALRASYDGLNEDFHQFFPELMTRVRQL